MHITRELYMPALKGIAVYAQSPSYTSVEGDSLIEAVKHEALAFDPDGRKRYYHPRIFRRRSDDNGRSWVDEPDLHTETPADLDGQQRHVPMHFLDEASDRLVSIFSTFEVDTNEFIFQGGSRIQRTYRLWYEVSTDGGGTWSLPRQIVDCREGYDETRWAPGIVFGANGAMADLSKPVVLHDGSFVLGLTVSSGPEDTGSDGEGSWKVGHMRSRLCDDHSLRVTFGELVEVSSTIAGSGCCEPATTMLTGDRLLTTMRCQGTEDGRLFSSRQCVISQDGGSTWGEPQPLRYDDGAEVYVPASYSSFMRSSVTGKTYLFANILPKPVLHQMPRYPLVMAELDTERGCVLRNSLTVIQDLPEGAPAERRYSNWGSYEERGTGNIILTMPEQPKSHDFTAMTRPDEFTADCYRWRVAV